MIPRSESQIERMVRRTPYLGWNRRSSSRLNRWLCPTPRTPKILWVQCDGERPRFKHMRASESEVDDERTCFPVGPARWARTWSVVPAGNMTLLRWRIGMPNCSTNCYTIKPFDFWVGKVSEDNHMRSFRLRSNGLNPPVFYGGHSVL